MEYLGHRKRAALAKKYFDLCLELNLDPVTCSEEGLAKVCSRVSSKQQELLLVVKKFRDTSDAVPIAKTSSPSNVSASSQPGPSKSSRRKRKLSEKSTETFRAKRTKMSERDDEEACSIPVPVFADSPEDTTTIVILDENSGPVAEGHFDDPSKDAKLKGSPVVVVTPKERKLADSIFERDDIHVVLFQKEVEKACWSVQKVEAEIVDLKTTTKSSKPGKGKKGKRPNQSSSEMAPSPFFRLSYKSSGRIPAKKSDPKGRRTTASPGQRIEPLPVEKKDVPSPRVDTPQSTRSVSEKPSSVVKKDSSKNRSSKTEKFLAEKRGIKRWLESDLEKDPDNVRKSFNVSVDEEKKHAEVRPAIKKSPEVLKLAETDSGRRKGTKRAASDEIESMPEKKKRVSAKLSPAAPTKSRSAVDRKEEKPTATKSPRPVPSSSSTRITSSPPPAAKKSTTKPQKKLQLAAEGFCLDCDGCKTGCDHSNHPRILFRDLSIHKRIYKNHTRLQPVSFTFDGVVALGLSLA